ncbi:hypothetical protein T265_03326 [Opisthorchis viverrini]|uniref:EDRF1 N-terminal domain-containing protein n=1 Tax=Opisthorchis viverrini TaxID=6198 RepID=A0A074ZSW5_OPIVI|nr:hypothetical protein T265_03326 [Opisthorchis viverrini]KER30166.1 hypothetical protein T265_03326 [Opisthorchis viverrini]
MANRYLSCLNEVDVITGIRGLKLLAKLTLDSNQRTSIMVHRIGNTWILDEFNIDSFLLAGEQSPEWYWLRKFLMKKNFYLCSEAFSRSSLILRDLYIKFLYHTVGHSPHLDLQRTIASLSYGNEVVRKSLPPPDSSPECLGFGRHAVTQRDTSNTSSGSSPSPSRLIESPRHDDNLNRSVGFRSRLDNAGCGKQAWTANPDEYLHKAKWQLQDLSFLVGSDLAIFGTPTHPCISLKLSPMHESINVLTGVDMWLENILNEVPEVVMCYHREGIVMQEYEIYKTCDLPAVTGFETEQVYRTVQNLVMFLKRNATQEGHTYWLVKEPGLDVVKLYDLTTLCNKDAVPGHGSQDESNTNPFILPVATLCYRLAERRWKEYQSRWTRRLSGRVDTNEAENMFADEAENLLDALRLVRNCLNLINLAELSKSKENEISESASTGLSDLKIRAVLLMCQLYLITPSDMIASCIRQLQSIVECGREVTVVPVKDLVACKELNDFHGPPPLESEESNLDNCELPHEDELVIKSSKRAKRRLLGNILMEALKSSDTSRMSELAIAIIESCNANLPVAPSSSPILDIIPPLTNERPTNSTSDILTRFQCSTHETLPTILLPISMLKIYLCKAQEFWLRSQQNLSAKPSAPSTCANHLKMVIRYTIPSLLVLEHIVPDNHTESFSVTLHCMCPYCESTGIPEYPPSPVLDRRLLVDLMYTASCLFPASLICYADAVRESASEQRAHLSDSIQLEPADCLLLRASCPSSAASLQFLFEATIRGPLEASSITSTPPTPDSLRHWLDLLYLAVRCIRRVFSSKRSDKSSVGKGPLQPKGGKLPHQQNKSKEQSKRTSVPSGAASSANIQSSHVDRFNISYDWWSVLVNMYVIALRRAFLDVPRSPDFPRVLARGMSMIRSPPAATSNLDGKSQLLTSTNEFQLYKLAAAATEQNIQGIWTDTLRSMPPDSDPILPLKTLIWEHDTTARPANEQPSENRTDDKFSLTSVCLARAIDSLLRHFSAVRSWNASNAVVQIQLCSSLLCTCNEYIASCVGEMDSIEFPRVLARGMSMIRSPPAATSNLDGKSQLLTSTNEFQLYKLAAAATEQNIQGIWTDTLRSMPPDSDPILPLKTLIWEHDTTARPANEQPSENRTDDKFSLTSVCLARAIDSLLRHFSAVRSWNASNAVVQIQLCSSLLCTCNEYIASCVGEMDSIEHMCTEYISILNTVMKQVMRRLPDDLSVSDSARLTSSAASSTSLPKNMVLQMLDFRLNQMNIAVQMHRNSSALQSNNRSSQAPAWSTIVGQARAALNWHAKYMVLPDPSDISVAPEVVMDLNMFLKLVNRLVALESVNLSVLSLTGVMTILKDLSLTEPVVAVLNHRWKSDPVFTEHKEALERSLQCLLHNLLIFCRYVVNKQQSAIPNKTECKSGGRRKAAKHRGSDSHPALSAEIDLALCITQTPEALQRLRLDSFDQLLSGLKEEGLDDFVVLCPLLSEKLKRLSTYFTQR